MYKTTLTLEQMQMLEPFVYKLFLESIKDNIDEEKQLSITDAIKNGHSYGVYGYSVTSELRAKFSTELLSSDYFLLSIKEEYFRKMTDIVKQDLADNAPGYFKKGQEIAREIVSRYSNGIIPFEHAKSIELDNSVKTTSGPYDDEFRKNEIKNLIDKLSKEPHKNLIALYGSIKDKILEKCTKHTVPESDIFDQILGTTIMNFYGKNIGEIKIEIFDNHDLTYILALLLLNHDFIKENASFINDRNIILLNADINAQLAREIFNDRIIEDVHNPLDITDYDEDLAATNYEVGNPTGDLFDNRQEESFMLSYEEASDYARRNAG